MSTQDLHALRHSAAHLLAAAVLRLYPDAKLAIGPSTDQGFYYDIDFPEPISDSALKTIEKTMKKTLNTWDKFERFELTKEEALGEFGHNPYKTELITEFADQNQTLTVYQSGHFRDLCRGGHIDTPNQQLRFFKLLSIAGAYWRGSEDNKMLTRIYGTAFFTQEELDSYLHNLEEAKKRDHKILGPELDLFTFSGKVGSGLPLWTPKGTIIRNQLNNFVQELRHQKGYQQVEIPHITKKDLYQTSGHWDKFKDELFRIQTREGHEFAMKPMNCPHHTQIFDRKTHSYRDLPQRYANTTMVYRDEQSGELAGLSRVRAITQDDAHVFCRESQVDQEVLAIWDIINTFYSGCGFPDLSIRLSLHDPDHMENYLGTPEQWRQSEDQLRQVLINNSANFTEAIGEAAFYGPKIDFMAQDSLGRQWQVATIQVDRNMPERFDLSCVSEHNQKERVVMIHAAIMGAIERFMAILIEHYAGAFPFWLASEQLAIIPINQDQHQTALALANSLKEANIRATLSADGSMQKRIRQAEQQKIPLMAIIGEREQANHTVSMRSRGQKDLGAIKTTQLIPILTQLIASKSLEIKL